VCRRRGRAAALDRRRPLGTCHRTLHQGGSAGMTAGTTAQAPDGTQVVLGEIGQKMLLENDRVRLWEVALAPGETQPWHLHHNPYLVVNIQASPCRMDWLDGAPP